MTLFFLLQYLENYQKEFYNTHTHTHYPHPIFELAIVHVILVLTSNKFLMLRGLSALPNYSNCFGLARQSTVKISYVMNPLLNFPFLIYLSLLFCNGKNIFGSRCQRFVPSMSFIFVWINKN